MEIKITPSELSGSVEIAESKSYAHRMLICAALAKEPCKIICVQSSEDIDATVRCITALGAKAERLADGFYVTPIKEVPETSEMDCGESGSTLRFILPVIAALGAKVRIKMSGRLPQRPLEPLWSELCKNGMTLCKKARDLLECGGKLKSGTFTLPGNISSQYISGLLFALPLIEGDSELIITGKIESEAYIDITREVLEKFGIKSEFVCDRFKIKGGQRAGLTGSCEVRAEGDWSNAAFWLCAGALSERGVTCTGLNLKSVQGDRKIVDILQRFGAGVFFDEYKITVRAGDLKGITIDASGVPDLVPVLATVACKAEGQTRIINAERLRIKESDRLKTVSEMLGALGAEIKETEDGLIINGSGEGLCGGAAADSCNDHRIAMSAAIASCICKEELTLTGAQAVNKSYPTFWERFKELGGITEEIK